MSKRKLQTTAHDSFSPPTSRENAATGLRGPNIGNAAIQERLRQSQAPQNGTDDGNSTTMTPATAKGEAPSTINGGTGRGGDAGKPSTPLSPEERVRLAELWTMYDNMLPSQDVLNAAHGGDNKGGPTTEWKRLAAQTCERTFNLLMAVQNGARRLDRQLEGQVQRDLLLLHKQLKDADAAEQKAKSSKKARREDNRGDAANSVVSKQDKADLIRLHGNIRRARKVLLDINKSGTIELLNDAQLIVALGTVLKMVMSLGGAGENAYRAVEGMAKGKLITGAGVGYFAGKELKDGADDLSNAFDLVRSLKTIQDEAVATFMEGAGFDGRMTIPELGAEIEGWLEEVDVIFSKYPLLRR